MRCAVGVRWTILALAIFWLLINALRFLWLATALVLVCLAALPTFLVAGLSLLHLRVFADHLWTFGWPR